MQALTPNPAPSAPQGEAPACRLINVKLAAGMYGVSWRTFLRWADAGLAPWGLKIGGRRLWTIAELEQHIASGCKPVRKGGRP